VVGAPAIGRGFWSAPAQQTLTTYTLQICVNGITMSLDVYAAGPPY
jgi:hypothetical protein